MRDYSLWQAEKDWVTGYFEEGKAVSIQTKSIASRNDLRFLRVTPDGKYVAFLSKTSKWNNEAVVKIYALDDVSYFPLSTMQMPEDQPRIEKMADIFDISHDGRFVAVTFDTHPMADGLDGMDCYVYDRDKKAYLPKFVSQNMLYKSYIAFGIDGGLGDNWIAVRFLNDSWLATVTISGEVFIWNVAKQQLVMSWTAAAHLASSVALSNKFGLYAIAEAHASFARGGRIGPYRTQYDTIKLSIDNWQPLRQGNFLRLWDIYSGTVICEFDADSEVENLVFSRDDSLLAGSVHTSVVLWDVNTGEQVLELPESTRPIGFSTNDEFLVIHNRTLRKSTIRLWDLARQKWFDTDYELEGEVTSVQLTDSNKIVALSRTITDWDLHQIQIPEC